MQSCLKNGSGESDIFHSIEQGELDEVEKILEKKPFAINAVDKNGKTPLLCAISLGEKTIVSKLLQYGVLTNTQDNTGSTALMLAASIKSNDIVEMLVINQGIDINMQDSHGWTALFLAAVRNEVGILKTLIRANADVNIHDQNRNSALVHAVNANNINIVEELVRTKQCSIDKINKDGWTALHCACKKHYVDIAKCLIEYRANPNIKDKRLKKTPIETIDIICPGDPSLSRQLKRNKVEIVGHIHWLERKSLLMFLKGCEIATLDDAASWTWNSGLCRLFNDEYCLREIVSLLYIHV